MYLRSSRRPLIVLVGVSLAINAILAIGFLQLRGHLDVTNHRIERIHATKADSQVLTKWTNRIRDCLDEIADRDDATGDLQRSCSSR